MTDHATECVTMGHIYVCSAAIPPSNDDSKALRKVVHSEEMDRRTRRYNESLLLLAWCVMLWALLTAVTRQVYRASSVTALRQLMIIVGRRRIVGAMDTGSEWTHVWSVVYSHGLLWSSVQLCKYAPKHRHRDIWHIGRMWLCITFPSTHFYVCPPKFSMPYEVFIAIMVSGAKNFHLHST